VARGKEHGEEADMFGFGKVTCILRDQRVDRKDALAVQRMKGYAVCRPCVDRWQAAGGTCRQCHAPLHGTQDPGIFLDGKRTFGHADCGAARLMAA
jgi:hypothetical protein